jgi:diguanylate cyclase (GGDEF)-like protein
MGPLQVLSEVIIETLKEFSAEKQPLTSTTLREALCAKEEICSLLNLVIVTPTNGEKHALSTFEDEPTIISRVEPEIRLETSIEYLSHVRNAFLKILDSLGPMIRDGHEKRYCDLQNKASACQSPQLLTKFGEEIGIMVSELITQAVERIDFTNDFLVELSKDLYKMEGQFSSYQDYNRETHQLNSNFNHDLLSKTNDIDQTFNLGKSLQDIHNLITCKLNTISKAIEFKRQSDEIRIREADTKIAELQNNLGTYKQEILQVKEQSESLKKEVLLDELTQINNRRAFDLEIKKSLRRYRRNKERFSLILMDIDHFKRVNDDYGHKAGDRCLKEIAQLAKSLLRQTDFLARYGGEELIAILRNCEARSARDVAEKIRGTIEKARFYYQDKIIRITISFGVTEVVTSDSDLEILFGRADQALYQAKKKGRNRVRVITGESSSKISVANS